MSQASEAAGRAIAALWRAPLGDPAYDDPSDGDPSGGGLAGGGLAGARASTARMAGAARASTPGAAPGSAARAESALRAAARLSSLGAFTELVSSAEAPGDGPLAGVPVAVKDMFDVAGQRVRNGTSGLGHRAASLDSDACALLRAAGAVVVGRTRLPDLAWSLTTPGCRNPWDPARTPGGSSGGSAVAVAAGVTPIALGTDTGGSIRVPAALCGIAGLRPTAGVISRRGVTPMAPTMDTVGPLAATSADCLLVHRVLLGEPGGTSGRAGGGLAGGGRAGGGLAGGGRMATEPPLARLRVGWPGDLWRGRVTADVAAATEAAADALREAGATVVGVQLPLAAGYARAAAYVIMLAESGGLWHEAARANPGGISAGTAGLLAVGAAVSAADYLRALRVARAIRRETDEALRGAGLSALLLPTVPAPAAPAGGTVMEVAGRLVPVESAYASLTSLASVAGLPALSVPSGLDRGGLPLGAQLVGPAGGEVVLCALGTVIEQSSPGRAVAARRHSLAVARR